MIRSAAMTGSTNADMLAAAAAGAPEGEWLRADLQTGGRGRLTRRWASPPGNLYASTIIRLRSGDPPAASLALVVGLAVHDAVTAFVGASADVRLKWPNDLIVGDAKLAGILLERQEQAIVAGIGVNLAAAPMLANRTTIALGDIAGPPPTPAAALDVVADSLVRRLRIWRGEGLDVIRTAWLAASHTLGTALAASHGSGQIEGLFAGLDRTGNLLLGCADGRTVTIYAGDVFLI